MSVANVISTPWVTDDFRRALKAQYNASLRSFTGFWAVIDSRSGLYVGRVESVNPDHGDIVINSVERIDVNLTSNKVWIRGSQVRAVVVLDGKNKDAAVAVARKMLPHYLDRRGEEL